MVAVATVQYHSRKTQTILNFLVKKPKKTTRNPYAIPAKARKSGKHNSKAKKRATGKNKQDEILKEAEV